MLQTLKLDGKEYVVIEKSEYEALLGTDEEIFPAEFVDKLFESENKIGVWREYRKMLMTALADAVGVSQGYLSEVENGKKDGSVKLIKAIAEILDADIDMII